MIYIPRKITAVRTNFLKRTQLVEKLTGMLDAIDRKILEAMQGDSSRSTAELADLAGVTISPCWRRVQRLKDEGYIKQEVALLDRRKLGLNTQVFAQIRLNAQGRERLDEFSAQIRSFPEVLDCYVIMGAIDFMLRIVTADVDAYEKFFFEKLSRVPGILEINSMVALSEIKATHMLPIPHSEK